MMGKNNEQKIDMRKVLKYFWDKAMEHKLYFWLSIFGVILGNTFFLYSWVYIRDLVDLLGSYTGGDKSYFVNQGIYYVLMFFGTYMIAYVGRRTTETCNSFLANKYIASVYNESFEKLHRHSYNFFINTFTGTLVSMINKLIGSIDRFWDTVIWQIMGLVINLIFVFYMIFYINFWGGVVVVIWFMVFVGFQYFFYKKLMKDESILNEKENTLTGVISDDISNNFNIITFASLKKENPYFKLKLRDMSSAQLKLRLRYTLMNAISAFLIISIEVFIFYVAIKMWSKDIIQIGTFIILQAYLINLMDKVFSLSSLFRSFFNSFSNAAPMIEVINKEVELVDIPDAQPLKVTDGSIRFEDVTFSYATSGEVFQNFNLDIKPGQKVALVGVSGSGKTSFTRLLFRLYDIKSGKILIDNQDISQVQQDSLRAQLSLVPQEPILFHRSLRDNIKYGKSDATDEEMIKYAKIARAHDFIMSLKDGYDSLVGERGIKLSGGEKQRVAIARAMLQNNKILVMDEATSSLDSESEKLIQDAMEDIFKNKTAIVIAHRLSTIMKMDRIIVLEKGKIVEDGTHHELLERGGMYKKLWDIQSGGFLPENL